MKYLGLFSLLLLAACGTTEGPNRWDDDTLRTIYDLQDHRNTQELLLYLQVSDAEHRAAAAEAFASVQDSAAIEPLALLLADEKIEVRQAAAYAIGQIGHPDGFPYLYGRYRQETELPVQAVLAEAMGKCATEATLPTLVQLRPNTETAKAGKLWGLYRAGLKRVVSEEGTELAIQALGSSSEGVRLPAVHYLNRANTGSLSAHETVLSQRAQHDDNAEVRMVLASVLRKVDAPGVAEVLAKIASEDPNPNVRINAWRALNPEQAEEIIPQIKAGLQSADPNEAVVVSGYVLGISEAAFATLMGGLELPSLDHRPLAVLLGRAITEGLTGYGPDQLRQAIDTTQDRYGKAAYINVLGTDYAWLPFIDSILVHAEDPVLSTAAMSALGNLVNPTSLTGDPEPLVLAIQHAFVKQDLASVAEASGLITNPIFENFLAEWSGTEALMQDMEEAKQVLELPRDVETLIALQAALDALAGKEDSEPVTNPYNHPINWERLAEVPEGQRVVLKTSKGNITWALAVNDAPGSVESFLSLVDAGYYNGKTLHRVVPNFVAQGGCPRGDGYGGQDYSIRSEFAPLRYTTGAVGLASAGKDTESCQWFITHSPTPHLDGRYTIFAYVVSGQDVAQQLVQGDVIESVTVLQ